MLVFGRDNVNVTVIQQRSPALKVTKPTLGRDLTMLIPHPTKSSKQDFVESLLEFIRTSGASAVLIIGGVDMSNRTDPQMLLSCSHSMSGLWIDVLSMPLGPPYVRLFHLEHLI